MAMAEAISDPRTHQTSLPSNLGVADLGEAMVAEDCSVAMG